MASVSTVNPHDVGSLSTSGAAAFPKVYAKTRRFTVGQPRTITAIRDGRILFLRSRDGDSPVLCLWSFDVERRIESIVVDPANLFAPGQSSNTVFSGDEEELPAAERARRERARESGSGIVSYSVDKNGRRACFSLGGSLFIVDLATGEVDSPIVTGTVFDPRLSPDGSRVAFVSGNDLRILDLDLGTDPDPESGSDTHTDTDTDADTDTDSDGNSRSQGAGSYWSSNEKRDDRALLTSNSKTVGYGRAEFIAAEEMQRNRGYWWSPDSSKLLVTTVDESPVTPWWIADPAHPSHQPNEVRYPAAGSANAQVGLLLVDLDGGTRTVLWDDDGRFEYLANVVWTADNDPLIVRQTRDQREVSIVSLDLNTLSLTAKRTITDDTWVELIPSSPTICDRGLLTIEDLTPVPGLVAPEAGDRRALMLDGKPVTDQSINARSIVGTIGGQVLITAWTEPTEVHLFLVDLADGGGPPLQLTTIPGVYGAVMGPADPGQDHSILTVVTGARPAADGVEVAVRPLALTDHERDEQTVSRGLGSPVGFIEDVSNRPPITAKPTFCQLGADRLESALFLPDGYSGDEPLPVLLDPYGGPHAQRVLKTQTAHLVSQWFADQGFAVLVTDGRGTPGRGPQWERQVWGDLATPVLEDQVAALEDAADEFGVLDLERVAIRGWSFGGYLAALALLRRPDRFHAAVAGAPVTDWRLYDTHYTERYLGRPDMHPRHYDTTDLTAEAHKLTRPLLLIHGLADDNVVAAHTLRLSTALLGAAAPHRVLPLSGVTHMTPQEAVAENLLWLQLTFIRQALGLVETGPGAAVNSGAVK
jgi:dipeptidyl-peptidase-4